MDLRLIYALILSIFPVSELRGGMPLAIIFANEHDVPIIFVFSLIVLANILAIFIAFFFLDRFHHILLKNRIYKKFFDFYIKRFQKRVDKFEKHYSAIGFMALALFVAIPLPVTGAWSGVLISWILNLDRKKSILSIALGVVIAGVLVSLTTMGLLGIFS